MHAGLLNQRVTIEQRSASVDTLGQGVETWSTVATVWAQAEPLAGREFLAAGSMLDRADVRFRITDATSGQALRSSTTRAEPVSRILNSSLSPSNSRIGRASTGVPLGSPGRHAGGPPKPSALEQAASVYPMRSF